MEALEKETLPLFCYKFAIPSHKHSPILHMNPYPATVDNMASSYQC